MMYPHRLSSLLIASVLVTSYSRADDESLALKIFPKATTVFFQVQSAKELREDLKSTSVGRMFQDPSVKDLIADLWSVADDSLAEFEEQFNVTLDELFEIAEGEFAIGIIKRPREAPGFAVLVDIGSRPDALHALLEKAEAMLLENGVDFSTETVGETSISLFEFSGGSKKRTLIFCERDAHLFVTTDLAIAKKAIAAWDDDKSVKSLGDDKIYKKTMKLAGRNQRTEPKIRVYIDPIATAYAVTGGNGVAQAGLAVIPLLGLKDVEGLAATVSINEGQFDWVLRAHLLISGDRHGIPEVLAFEGRRPNLPDWVPADISKCSQFQLDLQSSLRALEKLVDLFRGENTSSAFIKKQISERIEIDFEKDILPEITGRFIGMERNRPDATDINPTNGMAVEFKDAGKLERMLSQVALKYSLKEQTVGTARYYLIPVDGNRVDPDMASANAAGGGDANEGGRDRSSLNRRSTPAVGVIDKFLLACDDRDLMRHILENGSRNPFSKATVHNDVMTAIHDRLGIELPAFVSWSDNRTLWRHRFRLLASEEVRSGMRKGAESNPWAMGVVRAMDEHPLPPFEAVAKYFAPGGSVLTNEESGFHFTAFSLRPSE